LPVILREYRKADKTYVFMELNMMKIKTILPVFVAGMLALAECQLESVLKITKAEYVKENSFTVYYIGDLGSRVGFIAEGKNKQYTVWGTLSIF
jgi:hypothetical protein